MRMPVVNRREALESYLNFAISLAGLRAVLGPQWEFEREGDDFRLLGEQQIAESIAVTPRHVLHALELALTDAIPIGSLQEWANLLLMSDAYEIPPYIGEEGQEAVVQCLHDLASPTVFDGLTRETLLRLRNRLSSL